MSDGLNVRVLSPHTPTTDGYHEMVQVGYAVKRDALGRMHLSAYRSWLPFRCNNGDCKASAIVEVDSIGEAIEPLMGENPDA